MTPSEEMYKILLVYHSSGLQRPLLHRLYATTWHMAVWATGIMETATTWTSGTPSRKSFF